MIAGKVWPLAVEIRWGVGDWAMEFGLGIPSQNDSNNEQILHLALISRSNYSQNDMVAEEEAPYGDSPPKPSRLWPALDVLQALELREDPVVFSSAEFRRRARELADRHDAISQFARGFAHRLNNLLLGIVGNAGLLAMDVGSDARIAARLQEIETNALRASDVVRSLIEAAGESAGPRRVFDPGAIGRAAADEFALRCPPTLSFHADLAADVALVEGQPGAFRSVLDALLENARESLRGRAGSVSLRMEAAVFRDEDFERSLMHRSVRAGAFVVATVSDSGIGMSEPLMFRAFDPFFTTRLPGRGLGLYGVYAATRHHGGTIFCESRPGFGTKISVCFPVK